MPDVVKKCRKTNFLLLMIAEMSGQSLRQGSSEVHSTEHVLKPSMIGRGVDKLRAGELPQSTKPLDRLSV